MYFLKRKGINTQGDYVIRSITTSKHEEKELYRNIYTLLCSTAFYRAESLYLHSRTLNIIYSQYIYRSDRVFNANYRNKCIIFVVDCQDNC